jgi:hypothetical protein
MWNINRLEKVITHCHVELKLSRNTNQMCTLRDIWVVNLPTEMSHSDTKFWNIICCCPSRIQCTSTSTKIIQIILEYKMISVALPSTRRHWLKIWQFHLQHVPKCSTSKITAKGSTLYSNPSGTNLWQILRTVLQNHKNTTAGRRDVFNWSIRYRRIYFRENDLLKSNSMAALYKTAAVTSN